MWFALLFRDYVQRPRAAHPARTRKPSSPLSLFEFTRGGCHVSESGQVTVGDVAAAQSANSQVQSIWEVTLLDPTPELVVAGVVKPVAWPNVAARPLDRHATAACPVA